MAERTLNLLEKAFEKYEKATKEDEDDLEYLIEMTNKLDGLFQSFLNKYDIDYTPQKPIDNSSFIRASELINNKKFLINPQNNDDKSFQIFCNTFLQ